MVLLKNDGILPLKTSGVKIAGPDRAESQPFARAAVASATLSAGS
jgi:hypothetical protein